MSIELIYQDIPKIDILTTDLVSSWIEDELKSHGVTEPATVEVVVVDETTIQALNRDYRHKNYVTDVLSFSTSENISTNDLPMKYQSLGSIVLCWPVVLSQATEHSHSPLREAEILIRHSINHLIGYHHPGDN